MQLWPWPLRCSSRLDRRDRAWRSAARWPGSRPRGNWRPTSSPLEQPLALVAGDDPVELRLLGAGVVEVMVHHVVAESLARHLALLELADGVAQGMRESLHVRLVRVAFELRRHFELLFDSMQAGRQERGAREVRVDVGARAARLGTRALAVADDPEAAGAVVVSPGERRRRPRPGGVRLAGIDVGREEDRELGGVRDVAREVIAESLRLPVEGVAAVLPQARVHMARAADPAV